MALPSQKQADEQTEAGTYTAADGLPPQQLRRRVADNLRDRHDCLNLRSPRQPPRRGVP